MVSVQKVGAHKLKQPDQGNRGSLLVPIREPMGERIVSSTAKKTGHVCTSIDAKWNCLLWEVPDTGRVSLSFSHFVYALNQLVMFTQSHSIILLTLSSFRNMTCISFLSSMF